MWEDGESGEITPLQERDIYKQDWLGLRKLGEKGGLVFEVVPGKHMSIGDEVLERVFKVYFGPGGRRSEDDHEL